MDKSLFKYIWQHSRRDQIVICAVVLISLPFYYLSLDLPRRIVNEAIQGNAFKHGNDTVPFLVLHFDLPAWLGGGQMRLFDGISADRIQLLFGLSLAFLFFVLINGAFKYWINLAKGALGERMLRRMRFELFNLIMRFRPEALKRVKAAETATIIKDEVEPIGGFIGDAFILPIFLGTQAATALMFIVIQSTWLGLMAGAMVAVQLIVIPRMRRKLLVLGRQRQLASRRFAGRIGEVFDGQEAVRLHDATNWERAEIGSRLYELFNIRYQIYKRKFVVKFLNNLLAQMTPFLFYAIGGYFAVTGRLDIGQLVAVIGAYRDLPPPLKELIDWDQQRLDVQVKYDQIVEQFASDRLLPEEMPYHGNGADVGLESPLRVTHLKMLDGQGVPVLSDVSLEFPTPARVAVVGEFPGQSSALARALAQPSLCAVGHITSGKIEMTALPQSCRARMIGYVSNEPILFPGTIRDNLIYSLKSHLIQEGEEAEPLRGKRRLEASKTGNPLERPVDQWVDYAQAGAASPEELDHFLLNYLHAIGLGDDIYRFGQFQFFDPDRYPVFAERLIKARRRFHERLQAENMGHLVETFDNARYNRQATIAENLLFGIPASADLVGNELAAHPGFRKVLKNRKLETVLVNLGGKIAETMVEIFRGLTPGHPLFEQFSFLGADELDEYDAIVRRWNSRPHGLSQNERTQLIRLALGYVEPRHRLGLLDEAVCKRLTQSRKAIRLMLETMEPGRVEFYDRDRICPTASLRDNVLFGKIDLGIADARSRVAEVLRTIIDEMELRQPVERLGLSHQVGTAGRLLTAQQRAGIDLVRNLVKQPGILVVDGAFASFTPPQQRQLRDFLLRHCRTNESTLIMVIDDENALQGFDFAVTVSASRACVKDLVLGTERESGASHHRDGGLIEPEAVSGSFGKEA